MNPDSPLPNAMDDPNAGSNPSLDPSASPTESAPATAGAGSPLSGVDNPDDAGDEWSEEIPTGQSIWKDALRRQFETWMESIDVSSPPAETTETAESPDLYSFFEQLAAANAESRKANRRTAEAFSQWGDTLGRFDQELRSFRDHLGRLTADRTKEDSLSRPHALILIELFDRLQRLARAFQTPPAKSWWGNDAAWRQAWEIQRQAFEILLSHFEAFLAQEGIVRIEALQQPFDPATMTAVAAAPDAQRPHHTVIEEVVAGYRRHGELLRPAQVKVTLNPSNSTTP